MLADRPFHLSTGQAARLCSVTPDTILKWIKKGRINGVRTAGGHYRIARREIEPLIASPQAEQASSRLLSDRTGQHVHCWEYLNQDGAVSDECRQCVVYRVRADRCFLMAGLEPDVGHAHKFCQQDSCEDCVYYRWVRSLATNILVISCDDEFINGFASEENEGVTLRIARSGYEASAIVERFQAAFVVVDHALLSGGDQKLLACLAGDSRLPGARIVLGVGPGGAGDPSETIKEDTIWRVMTKPFGLRQLAVEIMETDLKPRRCRYAPGRI